MIEGVLMEIWVTQSLSLCESRSFFWLLRSDKRIAAFGGLELEDTLRLGVSHYSLVSVE